MSFTVPMRMTATIVDQYQVEAYCTTYALIDPTAAVSSITTTFNAWLSSLDAITDGRITAASYTLYPQLPALKGSIVAGANVSQTGLLACTGPSTPRRDSVAVPAIASSVITAGKIVTATGAVHTFINFLQTGGSSLEPATSDFDAPLTFKDATISFRKYNRALAPATLEVE